MSESNNVLGIKVGDKATFSKTVSDKDIATFAEVTGDLNPLHLDEAYASKTRFKGRIAHGMLSAGFISAALGTKLAPNAVVVYMSQQMRFQRPGEGRRHDHRQLRGYGDPARTPLRDREDRLR